jgi:phosphatidylinositol 4-kinase B
MGGNASNTKTQLTEEYRQSLLSSVFMETGDGEGRAIDMEKITMIIWCYRDSPEMVTFISNFLAKFSGEKLVFDGIEFYLPQLAHMIIHLEVDWPSTTLEQFALVISQHSLHFALQFNWILICALQDYQPETSSGEVNPTYNEVFFTRCIKLLQNMERCVVYGTPRASELRKLYEMGEISREEFEAMELADRRFNAFQIVDSPSQNVTERQLDLVDNITLGSGSDIEFSQGNSGWLLYKRGKRRKYRRKPWKRRFFVVAERMLFCYDRPNGTLRRAMPLESAIVNRPKDSKHPFYFEVRVDPKI